MKAKARGKRGGYRVIYYFVTADQAVWLITIYDKVQQENLSAADTARVLKIIETIQTAK
jgi:mRNA-degrading endonuclease RelE of RelBE toxin-antitoxin system